MDKQDIQDALQVEAFSQALVVMIEQAIAMGKEETLKSLSEVYTKFVQSLSEEEQKAFKEKLDVAFVNQGELLAQELEKMEDPAKAEEIGKALEQLAGDNKPQEEKKEE